jgi:hypothetical protein
MAVPVCNSRQHYAQNILAWEAINHEQRRGIWPVSTDIRRMNR